MAPSSPAKQVRVRLRVDGKEIVLTLRDSAATRDLVEQLPLTVKLSDHARTEKIAYPPKKLSIGGAPAGYDPSVGDVTYYAPCGNLAIFYEDFGYAKGLVPLGVVESGLEDLSAIEGDRSVVIERITDD